MRRKSRRRRDVAALPSKSSQKSQLRESQSSASHSLTKTMKHSLPKVEADRILYDAELRHLYDKLNNHFLKNNLEIERLDVVQLPNANHIIVPEPIVFHTTTTTTTSTTTTTTTTTTTPAPTTEATTEAATQQAAEVEVETKEKDYSESQEDLEDFETETIGRRVKIIGEVEVNEDKLSEPISVQVHGDKIRAQMDVEPIRQIHDQDGNVLHFSQSQPLIKPTKKRHRWHFGVHNHSRLDPRKIKPFHMRQFLLKKKLGKDPHPPNILARALSNGAHNVQDFAHYLFPKAFHGSKPEPAELPKTFKFKPFETPEDIHYLQHRKHPAGDDKVIDQAFAQKLNELKKRKRFKNGNPKELADMDYVEKGLLELHDADEEFPRVPEVDYHGESHL
jgi:hypothetical protein